jgi:hypothetical protein
MNRVAARLCCLRCHAATADIEEHMHALVPQLEDGPA